MRTSQLVVPLCICILFILQINDSPAVATATIKYGGNETDWLALLEIKAQITHDPMDHVTSSWNDSVHFCQWQGVSCDRRHHQRVTDLNLQSLNLVASYVSPFIGNLSFLRNINLSNNSIQGEIPPEIGKLFRLRVLNLMNNLMEGQIPPSISGCSNLRILALGENKLTGKIPAELGSSLSNLVRLRLDSNNLTGMIPPSLGNLSFLDLLRIDNNLLEGSIPHSLGQLKGLTYLVLFVNELSGMVPPSIYNLSSLNGLYMARNQLQGSLPRNLGLTLPNLRWLNIWGNQFSGSIPVSLSNASKLQNLQILGNGFSQEVPLIFGNMHNLSWVSMGFNHLGKGKDGDLNFISSLTNCSKLRILDLIGNNFGGRLPVSTTNLSTQLQVLSVAVNKIYGNIPMGIGNLVNLTSLDMHLNQFQGSIPSSIGVLHKLQEMGFGKNKLSGEIPSSIGNLTMLNQLWLEENNFQGSIPSTLGNCNKLILLHLYGNNLSGTIPKTVIGLSSLARSLNLAQNRLTGPLPLEVGNLVNLVELNVAHNELSGGIPISLGSCIRLERLYLGYNSFGGPIPWSLSSLRGIEVLDISHNNISGEIPKDLETILTLQSLNLSSNDLEGEVPIRGVFSNVSAVSISGNNKLCGGIPALQLPICSTNKPKKNKTSPPLKLIIPVVFGGVVGITLMLSFLVHLWFKKTRARPSSVSSEMELMSISYGELHKATNGFSSTNLIGKGNFGSVYKGILDPNQTSIIAVKVLNLNNNGAFRSFMAECKALRNIRHRNLVKILTACSSIDFHGDDFKALVYEFMPNGSLENWLHPVPQAVDDVLLLSNEGSKKLNLLQRLNIAIDVASALDYLHHDCQIPIIHCDLKPSNILLDGEMTARVGDFGLARFVQQNNDEIYQNQTVSSVGIKGTIGYAAPEYGMGSEVSTHGDVYSYGILLLEMFTGKRPTDSMFEDGLNLHKFATTGCLPERVTEILDHELVSDAQVKEVASSDTQTQVRRLKIIECLISILGVGVSCSKESPRERMDISEVAKELQFIKGMLLKNMPF